MRKEAFDNEIDREHYDDFILAASIVESIRQDCRSKKIKYKDPFSSHEIGLGDNMRRRYGDITTWTEITNICPVPHVVADGFSIDDIVQGAVGNCYLHAALSAIIQKNSFAIDRLIVTDEVNAEGVYCVRFWYNDQWKHVIVDDRFLVYTDRYHLLSEEDETLDNRERKAYAGTPDPSKGKYYVPVGATSTALNEFWILILEKAYAKLCGSISDSQSGNTVEALNFLVPDTAGGTQENVSNDVNEAEALWLRLSTYIYEDYLICASGKIGNILRDCKKRIKL